ncbi:MAG: antibiotic biosynthesis monooxygenase [Microcoleaceae cyanobacterium]
MTQVILDSDRQLVTAVICHLVKPGQEEAYEHWLHDISTVAQQFAGHSGVSFVRPADASHSEYAIILKFDCYQHLKAWMDSPIRQSWIDKAQPLVQSEQKVQVLTGLETWFTLPGKLVQRPPKRYKMAILTALAVFAIAQVLGLVVAPLLTSFPSLLRSFVLTVATVLILTYVIMPRVTRLFYGWLYPKHR